MIEVRPSADSDREWIAQLLNTRWGSTQSISRGRVHNADELPGLIATDASERVGLITYHIKEKSCEIVTLDSLRECCGIGTALVEAVRHAALDAGCTRLWLITTNDNIEALRFWQKRGFVLAAVHRGAMNVSRRLKPEIPTVGMHGIPIRDEIELEMHLECG